MSSSNGNAKRIRPKTTNNTNPSGSIINETRTFEIPHAALMEKRRTFPKIKNINRVNNKVHMYFLSLPSELLM